MTKDWKNLQMSVAAELDGQRLAVDGGPFAGLEGFLSLSRGIELSCCFPEHKHNVIYNCE